MGMLDLLFPIRGPSLHLNIQQDVQVYTSNSNVHPREESEYSREESASARIYLFARSLGESSVNLQTSPNPFPFFKQTFYAKFSGEILKKVWFCGSLVYCI